MWITILDPFFPPQTKVGLHKQVKSSKETSTTKENNTIPWYKIWNNRDCKLLFLGFIKKDTTSYSSTQSLE